MKYKHLLFDADNTLWDFDKSEAFALEKSLSSAGINYPSNYRNIYRKVNQKVWRAFEKGTLPQERIKTIRMERFLKKINSDADPILIAEYYKNHLSSTDFLVDGARELMIDLQSKGYQMTLVTNGLEDIQKARLKNTQFASYFNAIIISEEIGLSKPHAPYFEYTFDQIGNPDKSDVLMIGDSLNSDIRGGNQFGIDTCWFNPERKYNNNKIKPTYSIGKLDELYGIIGCEL